MKKQFLLLTALISSGAWATDAQIKQNLAKLDINEVQISNSPISGLKTVTTNQGVLYVSNDGKYMLHGTLYALDNGKVTNVTTQALMTNLNSMQKEMIVYPAVKQKYVVNVFTDITCPYCHMLHEQMQKYNDLGITVRYLAFPRAGLNSQAAEQMEAIWTEKDPNQAFNDATANNKLPSRHLSPKIVAQQYNLGRQFNIGGTPAIILENGEVLGGYVPPEKLLEILKQQ